MKIIPVKVEDGVLKLTGNLTIPPNSQLSILLASETEDSISILEGNKRFSFLESEPDIYSDNDILENRKNEKFSF